MTGELLIAIETATDVCSVVVANGREALSVVEVLRPRSHAEQLTPAMDEALRLADVQPHDLGAVGVSSGPGSYTGLRIGTSAAKGLAYGTGAALVAVPTLRALARSCAHFADTGTILVTLLNSRRAEVYFGAYRVLQEGRIEPEVDDAALNLDEAGEALRMLDADLWLMGEGAKRIREAGLLPPGARVIDSARPSAVWVALEAAERFRNGVFENLHDFEPNYLKDFVARKSGPIFDRLSEKIKKPDDTAG